jgi:hypothetical protein
MRYISQAQQLIAAIPANCEAEIRRIVVLGQPKQKVLETLSQSIKLGVVVHACLPATWEA